MSTETPKAGHNSATELEAYMPTFIQIRDEFQSAKDILTAAQTAFEPKRVTMGKALYHVSTLLPRSTNFEKWCSENMSRSVDDCKKLKALGAAETNLPGGAAQKLAENNARKKQARQDRDAETKAQADAQAATLAAAQAEADAAILAKAELEKKLAEALKPRQEIVDHATSHNLSLADLGRKMNVDFAKDFGVWATSALNKKQVAAVETLAAMAPADMIQVAAHLERLIEASPPA